MVKNEMNVSFKHKIFCQKIIIENQSIFDVNDDLKIDDGDPIEYFNIDRVNHIFEVTDVSNVVVTEPK